MMQQPMSQGPAQIFMGRVPPSVDLAFLEEQLVPFGATNVRMPPGKGCAFADFESAEAAESCIQSLHGAKLTADSAAGLNVKFAEARGGPKFAEVDAPQRTPRASEPKVFVGGLAQGVTEDSILELCSHYGAVYEAKLLSKRPGAPPCAFVLFSSFDEAESCIEGLHGFASDLAPSGKTLNVRLADQQQGTSAPRPPATTPKAFFAAPPQKAAAAPAPGGGAYTTGRGGGYKPARPGNGGIGQVLALPPVQGQGSQKLFVGGLSEDASEDFLRGLMSPWGDVVEAKLHRKPGAKPCGFVRLATQEEAERAVESHAQLGRYTVKIATEKKRDYGTAFDNDASIAV